MTRWLRIATVAGAGFLLAADGADGADAAPSLSAGDAAPPFALRGSDGSTHELASYAGERAVVIAWFPKAFTGG